MKLFKNIIKILIFTQIFILFLFACNNVDDQSKTVKQKTEKDTCIGKVSMHKRKTKMKFTDLQVKDDLKLNFDKNKYKLIPEQSELEWFCGKHTGFVLLKDGFLQAENGKLISGSFTVNMDSIYDTDIDNDLMRGTLENVLRSEDFFDIRKYPEAYFNITEVNKDHGNLYTISGKLKIKNIDKTIRFKSIFELSGDTLYAQSEKFIIDRTDWGVTHMSKKTAKSDDAFVFTDSLQFIVHLKAIGQ